jgi:hypothetical protein
VRSTTPPTWSGRPGWPSRPGFEALRISAGFDEVYVGQVGGAPEAFFGFFAEQVLPRAREN